MMLVKPLLSKLIVQSEKVRELEQTILFCTSFYGSIRIGREGNK